ncbi:transposase, IS4 family [Microbispora rosea]|uniref:Transposase, IS4 family n=1 Tax=Microbispora rosea TaxID=58117 RepID=A0A1N7C349_9ACTN|nr:transposase, IS4 family [Microbispora rosea]
MPPEHLAHVRRQLELFAAEMFAPLARRDQRAKGLTYLRGLLLDGRRKSMQPMAERLGVDHQGLQQFLTSSTWDPTEVRRRLATRAIDTITPAAWVIDDTGFPKDGIASPGVARQYSGTLGKVGNCQIGVSVHAVTDAASCPLNWRLFLPASWDPAHAGDDEATAAQVTARRARCAIPDGEHHRPKWQLAVEMLDELAAWGLVPPLVVADAAYGDNARLRAALAERGCHYVVQVKGAVTAHHATDEPDPVTYSGRGRPPRPHRYPNRPISLREHVLAVGRQAAITVTWRTGSKGAMTAQFVILVRVAGRRPHPAGDGTLPVNVLIAQWPAGEAEPIKYWLTDLPADTPSATLIALAKIRWRIEHDYRELKTGLGLDHFEGRSWIGWHRHVTLVTAAHLFCTELRLHDPKAAA